MPREKIPFKEGKRDGIYDARMGYPKCTVFMPGKDNESYIQGYHFGYEKTQHQKGWQRGYDAVRNGSIRRTIFSGALNDPDFIEGYNEAYDETMRAQSNREPMNVEISIVDDSLKIDIPCYRHPFIQGAVLFYFESKNASNSSPSANARQKDGGRESNAFHQDRASLFASNLKNNINKTLEGLPGKLVDSGECIHAKDHLVIVEKFSVVCEILCSKNDLAIWMLKENSFSASHYPFPPQKILDELLKSENISQSSLLNESNNFVTSSDPLLCNELIYDSFSFNEYLLNDTPGFLSWCESDENTKNTVANYFPDQKSIVDDDSKLPEGYSGFFSNTPCFFAFNKNNPCDKNEKDIKQEVDGKTPQLLTRYR
jgi:hypothetical protein